MTKSVFPPIHILNKYYDKLLRHSVQQM